MVQRVSGAIVWLHLWDLEVTENRLCHDPLEERRSGPMQLSFPFFSPVSQFSDLLLYPLELFCLTILDECPMPSAVVRRGVHGGVRWESEMFPH